MAETMTFSDGGYRFIRGVLPYSGGVGALEGMEIERARFRRPVALTEGFRAIEVHLKSIGRPLTSFCACELRSPAPFTEQGFADFNREYVGTLERWKIFRDGINPVARSNVCPEIEPPESPSFFAFSYTVPARVGARPSFAIAGSAECPEGHPNYRDYIVRRGDTTTGGLREKARWVLAEMERRMGALGFDWPQTSATQLYTVHDVHPFMADDLVRRGATAGGLAWHFARPPIVGLEYEMDVRGVTREHVL